MTDAGYRTFVDMVGEVGRLIHDTSTGRKTAIKEAINRAYEGACNLVEWPEFQMVDETGLRLGGSSSIKTFESSEAEFPLPIGTGRLLSLHYQDTSEPIEIVPPKTLYEKAASLLTTTGRPRYVAQVGVTAQYRRLSAEGSLTMFSPNSSSNDNVYSPVVELKRSGTPIGHESTVVTVSGSFTTGVQVVQSAAEGWPISKIIAPEGWVGLLTIEDSLGTVIARVPTDFIPAETAANNMARISTGPLYRAWPTPDQDYGLTVCWVRQPRRLVEDNDSPEIPVGPYIIEKAAAEMLRHENKDAMARSHEAEAIGYLRGKTNRERPGAFVGPLRMGSFISGTDMPR